jgi:hypothetical protein
LIAILREPYLLLKELRLHAALRISQALNATQLKAGMDS